MLVRLVSAIVLGRIGYAHGATIAVGPGTDCDFETIQAGIDAANGGDAVLVAPGEYVIAEPITLRGKAITVISEAGPDQTTIRMGTPADPDRCSVVIFDDNETVASVLEGFTITGGKGSLVPSANAFGGGGILFAASSGTLRNCAIVRNRTENGGGVGCAYPCSPTLIDCIIAENSTSGGSGGGVFAWGSFPTLTGCIITGNSSESSGGAVMCQDSSVTITDCTISENSAAENGGAIFCWKNLSLSLTNCEMTGNNAGGSGGAMECASSSATVTNCLIGRNTSGRRGGGLCCVYADSSMTVNNCTIWGNSAAQTGGGVAYYGVFATVTNSILWQNTAPLGRQISLEAGSTLGITCSNIDGGRTVARADGGCTLNWDAGNIDTDPLFVRLDYVDDNGTRDPEDDFWVAGDYHLKSQAGRWDPDSQTWVKDDVTSPCIDAGDPMSPIGRESFPNGGFVNMGVYGGTSEATKSYFGAPVCERIIAGDVNGDGQVNRADLEIMALHWTDEEPLPLP